MHNSTNYPPYNLVEVSEDTYMIELALAGFKKEDISIEQEKNVLTIKGSSEEDENKYIHKGIGARAFTRTFSLSEYMNVAGVAMENGVLRVLVLKLVPEEARPKTFEILDSFTPEEKVFAPSSRKKKKEIV
jgi:molecular chaperone IbpA